jgi:hypothetical protein
MVVVQIGLWVFGTAFAVAIMIVTVAMGYHAGQFALSLIVTMFIAVSAMRHFSVFRAAGTHPSLQAAVIIRYMGMVWAWGAVGLIAIYQFLLTWDAWLASFVLLLTGALALLFVGKILDRDALENNDDPRVLELVRLVAKGQFVLTCIALGGLLAYGKFSAAAFAGDDAWAAMNILLTTALGLALMSGYYLVFVGMPDPPEATAETAAETVSPVRRRRPVVATAAERSRPLRKVQPGQPVRMRTA